MQYVINLIICRIKTLEFFISDGRIQVENRRELKALETQLRLLKRATGLSPIDKPTAIVFKDPKELTDFIVRTIEITNPDVVKSCGTIDYVHEMGVSAIQNYLNVILWKTT